MDSTQDNVYSSAMDSQDNAYPSETLTSADLPFPTLDPLTGLYQTAPTTTSTFTFAEPLGPYPTMPIHSEHPPPQLPGFNSPFAITDPPAISAILFGNNSTNQTSYEYPSPEPQVASVPEAAPAPAPAPAPTRRSVRLRASTRQQATAPSLPRTPNPNRIYKTTAQHRQSSTASRQRAQATMLEKARLLHSLIPKEHELPQPARSGGDGEIGRALDEAIAYLRALQGVEENEEGEGLPVLGEAEMANIDPALR